VRFVIQRVTEATVTVDEKITGTIGNGFLVFIGIGKKDTQEVADRMIRKMLCLRIFRDKTGRINLSLSDMGGALLLVSQFTLYADCRKGNRPGFEDAGEPQTAEKMYNYIVEKCRESIPTVEKGIFGAEMSVRLINDGPFTILLDSDVLFPVKQGPAVKSVTSSAD
jgi:D-aminoacyl-tRNA deacylase